MLVTPAGTGFVTDTAVWLGQKSREGNTGGRIGLRSLGCELRDLQKLLGLSIPLCVSSVEMAASVSQGCATLPACRLESTCRQLAADF